MDWLDQSVGGMEVFVSMAGCLATLILVAAFASSVSAVGWLPAADSPMALAFSAVAVIDTTIFVMGGYDYSYDYTDYGVYESPIVWGYDVVEDTWSEVGQLPAPLAGNQVQGIALDGILYVCGLSTNCYRSETATLEWTPISSIPTGRARASAAQFGDGFCVVGGGDGDYRAIASVDCYNVTADVWSTVASLPIPATSVLPLSINGSLYAFGGYSTYASQLDTVLRLSSMSGNWTNIATLPYGGATGIAGSTWNGSAILACGSGGTTWHNLTLVFYPDNCTFARKEDYPVTTYYAAGATVDSNVYIVNGFFSNSTNYLQFGDPLTTQPTPPPPPVSSQSTAEQVANVAVPVAVAGAEVTAAAISLAPTLLAAAHGIATTTQPLSVSPLIWITFAYTQHIAMTIFFPGSLPDTYNTYASLFSWTIGMAPFGITFPFQPTNSTDNAAANSSLKKGNGLSRKLLDVDDAVAEFQVSETQLLAAMLFWVLVLLLVAIAVVPLITAIILTVQRNRLEVRLNEKSGDGLSEQNPLIEKSPGMGSLTLQEESQPTQPDPGGKERPGLRDCLEIEASKPLDTRRSSYAWFAVCFLSSLVLVSASVLSLFYSSLLTLCATQILLPWTYEGNLGTMDKVMVALAITITFVVGLGVPLWSAAAAYVVRSDKEPSIEKELSMVPSVRKFKARTAFFGLVLYGSMFANAWLVALLQNQALAFYAASVLVQMFVFCGIFFTRPYKQKVVFAWQLVSSAAITLRLVFLTILMYQEGEGTSVSWVLVALPITLDTFVVCGTLLMSVKSFLVALWRMCRSRCKSSRTLEDEDASL